MALGSRRVRVNIQVTEQSPEPLLTFKVEILIPKKEDPVMPQSRTMLGSLRLIQRAREINIVNFSAEYWRDRARAEGPPGWR